MTEQQKPKPPGTVGWIDLTVDKATWEPAVSLG